MEDNRRRKKSSGAERGKLDSRLKEAEHITVAKIESA